MKGKRLDLTGKRFHEFLVQERLPGYPTKYICLCSCGKESTIYHGNLQKGLSKRCQSCGYKHAKEILLSRNPNHKWRGTHEFKLWNSLRSREIPIAWKTIDEMIQDMGSPNSKHIVVYPGSAVIDKTTCRYSNFSHIKRPVLYQGKLCSFSEAASLAGISRERVRQLVNQYGKDAFSPNRKRTRGKGRKNNG